MSSQEAPQASNRIANVVEEIDLQQMIQILLRHLWIIIIVTILGGVGGMVLTAVTDPTYQTEAELLITSEGGGMAQMSFLTGSAPSSDKLQNRVQVLRSPVVLGPASAKLAEWGFAEAAADLDKRLSVSIVQNTDVLRVTLSGGTPEEAQRAAEAVVQSYEQYSEDRAQQQMVRLLEFLTVQVERALEEVQQAEMAIRDFQQETGIIYLTSEEAKVNQHMASLESQLMTAEIRLQENRMRLEHTGRELEEARRELPQSTTMAAEQVVGELQKLLASLQSQRVDFVSRGLEGTPEIRQLDQRIASVTEQIQDHLAQVAQETGDPRGAFAVYQELVMEEIRLQAEILGYENQLTLLNDRIADYQEELWRLSDKAFEYARLERDVTVSNDTYAMLFQELEKTRIAVEREMADVQVIRPPVLPEYPVSPRRMLNLAIGLVLGMMLSVGGVFTKEFLDNSVKSRRQLERLGLPLLGTIPKVKGVKKRPGRLLMLGDDATDMVAAAYVRIESNLRLSSLDQQPQVIVSTSAIPGEGKSTTSLNFAVSLAASGQKVLLIDGDLRRPVLHRSLGEERSPGLTEIVSGQVDVEDAIRTVQSDRHTLDVITAGVRPPSVANTFRSQAFKSMIAELRQEYEWIVIDLPPVVVGAEAMEVAVQSDGALLVIEAGETSMQVLEEAMIQLEQASVPILGAVLNQYDPKAAGDAYDYESYYTDDDPL